MVLTIVTSDLLRAARHRRAQVLPWTLPQAENSVAINICGFDDPQLAMRDAGLPPGQP